MSFNEADLLEQGPLPLYRWDLGSDGIYVPSPVPVDAKINEGLRLYNQPDEDLLESVGERVGQAFKSMHHDLTREYGACLAYGVEIDEGSQELVDARILRDIEARKGKIETQYQDETSAQLWLGRVGLREFKLRKNNGPIMLNDGSVPDSVVYCLLSKSRR